MTTGDSQRRMRAAWYERVEAALAAIQARFGVGAVRRGSEPVRVDQRSLLACYAPTWQRQCQ